MPDKPEVEINETIITNLDEWIQKENNYKTYLQWRNNPLTKVFLNSFKYECRPESIPMGMVTAEHSLYINGINTGKDELIHRMLHLEAEEVPERELNMNPLIDRLCAENRSLTRDQAKKLLEENVSTIISNLQGGE